MFGTSFATPQTLPLTADGFTSSAASASSSPHALFSLGENYGDDAALQLAGILQQLSSAGFHKANAAEYSAFDRILSGICWLLQRLVKREQAQQGRVQWELLFQAHEKMKPRLGLAQEVVQRLDLLPFPYPMAQIQPHQLLLQDFGDIGAVQKLVQWLLEQLSGSQAATSRHHLEKFQQTRAYLSVVYQQEQQEQLPPLKKEVVYLQKVYAPRRRYQYQTQIQEQQDEDEDEDALIQRCLLEYGERVAVPTVATLCSSTAGDALADTASTTGDADMGTESSRMALMAQLAASASSASLRRRQESQSQDQSQDQSQRKLRTGSRSSSSRGNAFDAQYQRIVEQSEMEQEALAKKQQARQEQLLQQVVLLAPAVDDDAHGNQNENSYSTTTTTEELRTIQTSLHTHEEQLSALQQVAHELASQKEALAAELQGAGTTVHELHSEAQQLKQQEEASTTSSSLLPTLRGLVAKNEDLKAKKSALKTQCKLELNQIQLRIEQLRQRAQNDGENDESRQRLAEIEQLHTQMQQKHHDLQLALSQKTREIHLKWKQIDEIPTRIEIVQYEKRFCELYDQVSLTLDETRKYYSVYNTLTTTHEFLEKEITLLNSIYDNFDLAMSSKQATQVFFTQLTGIVHGVETSVKKQQALRVENMEKVELLDSKYQFLLEKERKYVTAIREFQKECEKNDKLTAKLMQYQDHLERQTTAHKKRTKMVTTGEGTAAGVSLDDVVI